MSCSKYTLTNEGSKIIYFNYRKCDDEIWENQVPLYPNQVKNIWQIQDTFITAFNLDTINIVDNGVWPPISIIPTPSTTPTNTPTPSVTQTTTNTPTPTPTLTETPTNTPTPTLTTTPTTTQSLFEFILASGATNTDACNNYTSLITQTYYSNKSTITVSPPTGLWLDSALTTEVPQLWFANGTNVYAANVNGFGINGVINQQGFC
jgi:hypothetical protein